MRPDSPGDPHRPSIHTPQRSQTPLTTRPQHRSYCISIHMTPNKRSRASSIASNDGATAIATAAAAAVPSSSHAASTLPASGPLVHASQDLDDFQASFWRYQMDLVEQGGDADGNIVDFKSGLPTQGQLPLARIKKVMKSDDQVKMISAEAPILFARACEIFISDLTCRAFLIAEEHKRRTIQRSDVTGAIGRSDLFDFLIDIVPRHESVPSSRLPGGGAARREKTGEGRGLGRSNADASASTKQQQNQAVSYDNHLLHSMAGAYDDAEASSSTTAALTEEGGAGSSSQSYNIPHTSNANVNVGHTPMSHWIHDNSADQHSSQPDDHHATHSHHHAASSIHASHPGGASAAHDHQQPHHHAHHHHLAQHAGSHHSHHHSPLDYVTSSSNAGTPNSIGAGSATGGAWPHTFSGF